MVSFDGVLRFLLNALCKTIYRKSCRFIRKHSN